MPIEVARWLLAERDWRIKMCVARVRQLETDYDELHRLTDWFAAERDWLLYLTTK